MTRRVEEHRVWRRGCWQSALSTSLQAWQQPLHTSLEMILQAVPQEWDKLLPCHAWAWWSTDSKGAGQGVYHPVLANLLQKLSKHNMFNFFSLVKLTEFYQIYSFDGFLYIYRAFWLLSPSSLISLPSLSSPPPQVPFPGPCLICFVANWPFSRIHK